MSQGLARRGESVVNVSAVLNHCQALSRNHGQAPTSRNHGQDPTRRSPKRKRSRPSYLPQFSAPRCTILGRFLLKATCPWMGLLRIYTEAVFCGRGQGVPEFIIGSASQKTDLMVRSTSSSCPRHDDFGTLRAYQATPIASQSAWLQAVILAMGPDCACRASDREFVD
jgi:hypothetical protein